MIKFFESIKIKDGKIENIEFHNKRFNETMQIVFRNNKKRNLEDLIKIPDESLSGIFKCRIVYSSVIEKIEFHPYHKREIRTIKLVHNDDIDYSLKYEDKTPLEKLKAQHPDYDDIIIVKNGFITDTTFSNTVFFDGAEWHTPAEPLLRGTKRDKLISAHIIKPVEMTVDDIRDYTRVSFINAMLDLEELMIDTDCIA